jgi:hypothetical protein
VDHPIEDRVRKRRNADHIVPAVNRYLTGDHDRAGVVTILDNFEKVARLVWGERFRSPVVEDEQLGAGDRAQELTVTPIATRQGQIGEEPRHAVVEDGHVLLAGFLAQGAGEPALAETAQANDILPKNTSLRLSSNIRITRLLESGSPSFGALSMGGWSILW